MWLIIAACVHGHSAVGRVFDAYTQVQIHMHTRQGHEDVQPQPPSQQQQPEVPHCGNGCSQVARSTSTAVGAEGGASSSATHHPSSSESRAVDERNQQDAALLSSQVDTLCELLAGVACGCPSRGYLAHVVQEQGSLEVCLCLWGDFAHRYMA